MNVVIALMQHETNTFSPLPTTLSAFAQTVGMELPPVGETALQIYGKADFAFAAFVDVARDYGAEIEVPVAAYAEPSGKVSDAAFDYLSDKICSSVKNGCDAVLLDLHGAMVTETFDDGEGELLKRIRMVNDTVPIAVALDFHTNLTDDMVSNANVLTGYCTYPHVDMYNTGLRAGRTLFWAIDKNKKTFLRRRYVPIMTHMLKQTPAEQPMKDIMDMATEAERRGEVLNASVFGGFPLADIAHVSFSALTVEDETSSAGERLLDEIASMAWQRRSEFVFDAEPLPHSISRAKDLERGPVLIADHGDNCGAGGSMDDMTVLQEMLSQGLTDIVAGPIWDPAAVQSMITAGQDRTLTIDIGGKTDAPSIGQKGRSLRVTGRVSCVTDGKFVVTGPMQTGLQVNLGRTAVIDCDNSLTVVVCEQRWEPFDPGCFTHAGIDLLARKYILIKSRQHFRATFESIARHIILAAGPGVCSSDYKQFPFRNLKRPIYPLDVDMEPGPP